MDAIKVCLFGLRRCFSFFDNLKINACLCFSTRFPKIFFRFYPIKIYISKIKKSSILIIEQFSAKHEIIFFFLEMYTVCTTTLSRFVNPIS